MKLSWCGEGREDCKERSHDHGMSYHVPILLSRYGLTRALQINLSPDVLPVCLVLKTELMSSALSSKMGVKLVL